MRSKVFSATVGAISSILVLSSTATLGASTSDIAAVSDGTGIALVSIGDYSETERNVAPRLLIWENETQWNVGAPPIDTIVLDDRNNSQQPAGAGASDDNALLIFGIPPSALIRADFVRRSDDGSIIAASDQYNVSWADWNRYFTDSCSAPEITLCGTVESSPGAQPYVLIDNGFTHDEVEVVDGNFEWTVPADWEEPTGTNGDWLDLTVAVHDRAGIDASTGLSLGGSPYPSVLLPKGTSLNLGVMTMTPGVQVTGTIKKLIDGIPSQLVQADFESLCVRAVGVGIAVRSTICADPNSGFGFDVSDPGKWRLVLTPGDYVFKVLPRNPGFITDESPPKYFGGVRTPSGKVAWAGWLGESDVSVSVESEPVENIDAVILPVGEPTTIEITNIPYSICPAGRIDFAPLESDPVALNYFGGQQFSKIAVENCPPGSDQTVIQAEVWAPDGMKYSSNQLFGDGDLGSFWTLGGSSAKKSRAVTSGMTIKERWQPGPIWLQLAREDLSLYGNGEACIVLIARNSLDGTPSASGCSEFLVWWAGVVRLQQVPLGTYDVIAYRQDTDGKMIGEPTIIRGFEVTNDLMQVAPMPGMMRVFRHGLFDFTYVKKEFLSRTYRNVWTVVVRSGTQSLSKQGTMSGWGRIFPLSSTALDIKKGLWPEIDVPRNVMRMLRPYKLTLSVVGNGLVRTSLSRFKCTNRCSALLATRAKITITAIAPIGQRFNGWGGACKSAGQQSRCTIRVGKASSVSAKFVSAQ